MPSANCGFPTSPDLLEQLGPMLQINVGFDAEYDPDHHNPPRLQSSGMLALVDTGASECFIDSSLAMSLGLPVVDRQTVSSAQGAIEVNSYLAQIHVPSLDQVIHGQFAGTRLQPGMRPFVALIGRSFLRKFTMTYEGRSGRVTLSND